mmetsp:Transcript_6687/g.10742  ORF Transcript_6687/g.10742 Transcript_6687/m.10742 type:complete len:159 (-) Transcript_6687:106-582(-)
MKFTYLALLATASAVQLRYDVSEGPTKVDNGENDNLVVRREEDDDGDSKWVNPNARHDDGEDDDVVVLQTDGSQMILRKRRIYDEDGDGVEDNVEKTRDELDRFYIPAVYGVVEDIHNTHHGNLPGHVRREEYEDQPVYHSPYTASDFEGFEDLHIHI